MLGTCSNQRGGQRPRQRWIIGLSALASVLIVWATLLFTQTIPRLQAQSFTTWYVRPDGGSTVQCTGKVDAPYPGTGENQPCAWDHPFRALPPGQTPRLQGGDTLLIAHGSYMMGYGAPETTNGECYAPAGWDCYMPPIPSGPDSSHPTRILGASWNTGCSQAPELWGTQRTGRILNLEDASYLDVACLEITDHASCIDMHPNPAVRCERETYPFGDWASLGLWAEDSVNVTLRQLNIHGMAGTGVVAGRLKDWLVEDVRIAGNAYAGWDGDLYGQDNDRNSGDLIFRRWLVEWNGCVESWPDQQINNCFAQSVGGYGDGVGTGYTGGRWVIEDSTIRYNTSDGLDLLYVDSGTIEVRRSRFYGNAGNQVKTKGPIYIDNSLIVSNCDFFTDKPFTYNVDKCRAVGTALVMVLRNTEPATVINSTLASHGDCLVNAGSNGVNNTNTKVVMRNNIFQGYTSVLYPEPTCLAYVYNPDAPDAVIEFDIDYSVINNVRHDACPGTVAYCNQGAGLSNLDINNFDGHLTANSIAINRGDSAFAPAVDLDGNPRDSLPDIGAYEWQSSNPPTATPTHTPTHTPTQTPTFTSTPTPTATPNVNKGAIGGQVTDENGAQLNRIRVNAYRQVNNSFKQTNRTWSDAAGNYQLTNLTPGVYRIGFRDPSSNYLPEYYDNKNVFLSADTVLVTGGSTVAGIDAALAAVRKAKAQISGNVAHSVEATGQVNVIAWSGSAVTLTTDVAVCPPTTKQPTIIQPENVRLLAGLRDFPLNKIAGTDAMYAVTLRAPAQLPIGDVYPLEVEWTCPGQMRSDNARQEFVEALGEISVIADQPLGQVIDAATQQPIAGATVTLYKAGESCAALFASETEWLGQAVEASESTVKPVLAAWQTGSDGHYDWNVSGQCWYVEVEAPGYQSAISQLFDSSSVSLPATQLTPSFSAYLPLISTD